MDEYYDDIDPVDTEALLKDAVVEIIRHEDPVHFMQWLRSNISRYFMDEMVELQGDADMPRAMATMLGMAIWNATPLPGNGYRTRPLPKPKRNDSCPCGSGRKFKRCCYGGKMLPPLGSDFAWVILFEQLSPVGKKEVLAAGLVPFSSLVALAYTYFKEERPRKVVQVLEPLFVPPFNQDGVELSSAFDLLLDAYDYLGYCNKKDKLIHLLLAQPHPSSLRSSVYQRRAVMLMDLDDRPGAWDAFKRAQQDSPDDPGVGMAEVQLHLAEGNEQLAAQRADFWFKRLRRQGVADDDLMMDFFAEVSRDPMAAQVQMEMEMGGEAGRELRDWLEEVEDCPLPLYGLESLGGEALIDDEESFADDAALSADDFLLETPSVLLGLEQEWADIFPQGKPFSVNLTSPGDEYVWALEEEAKWSGFLHRFPEAYDSIYILDDLAAAVEQHPAFPASGIIATFYLPLLRRSEAILDKVLVGCQSPCRLPWLFDENRPALRSLYRLAYCYLNCEQHRKFISAADKLLAINPRDNHGIRRDLCNTLLRVGDDREALALAHRYPDDLFAELVYGQVLALFRLEKKGEAAVALAEAMARLPKVPGYLCRERIKEPKLSPHGIQLGGDDQAWMYRQEMRDLWQMTPGVMTWLKKQCRV